MKRFLCLTLALIMILFSFALVACDDTDDDDNAIDAGDNNDDNDNKDDNKDDNEDKDNKDELTIPEGYKLYENDDISFAYPEDWEVTDGSTVIITDLLNGGNNITVVYEPKTDIYDDMEISDFNEMFKPVFEAMGMNVTNPDVDSATNDNGLKMTKIAYSASTQGIAMKQTLYITTVGSRTYTVTVTETTSDAELVENVFDTLALVK